jgi:hypothetical protein
MQLVLKDTKESATFEIKAYNFLTKEFTLLNNIFGVYYMDGNPTALLMGASGVSGVGSITAKGGKTYSLYYSVNAEGLSGPVNMSFIDGQGMAREFFFSNIKGSLLK